MDVHIGVTYTGKEIELELADDADRDDVIKDVEAAARQRRAVSCGSPTSGASTRGHPGRQGRVRRDRQRRATTAGWGSGPIRSARVTAPNLLDRKLLFVTGKGGVGKSTVAAALALLAAERGKRTLVCEFDAKGNLADFFETARRRSSPARSHPTSSPCRWTPRSRSRST